MIFRVAQIAQKIKLLRAFIRQMFKGCTQTAHLELATASYSTIVSTIFSTLKHRMTVARAELTVTLKSFNMVWFRL